MPCSCIINGLNWQPVAKASFDHKRQSGALATIARFYLSVSFYFCVGRVSEVPPHVGLRLLPLYRRSEHRSARS